MVIVISIGQISQHKVVHSQPIVEFRCVSDEAPVVGLARKVLNIARDSLENAHCVTVNSLIDEGRPAAGGPCILVLRPGRPIFFGAFPILDPPKNLVGRATPDCLKQWMTFANPSSQFPRVYPNTRLQCRPPFDTVLFGLDSDNHGRALSS